MHWSKYQLKGLTSVKPLLKTRFFQKFAKVRKLVKQTFWQCDCIRVNLLIAISHKISSVILYLLNVEMCEVEVV